MFVRKPFDSSNNSMSSS